MKELDTVKLLCDYDNISKDTMGCIVLEYDKSAFEVEFIDENGDTIDVVTVPSKYLELVKEN